MSATRPATPPLLKRLNQEAVLETIRAAAPISRAEISRRVGISKPTVSVALRSLLDAGLVREAPTGPSGPSYGAVYFEPVAEAALVVGIDLGARFLRGAVSDLSGAVRARQDVEHGGVDCDGALAAIVELRDSLLRAAGLPVELVHDVVVGIPGVVESKDGTVSLALNVPGLDGRRFGAELRELLGVSVHVVNDVNLAALGEGRTGVARGVQDFAFLSVGTGLGAGIVLRGELQRGHHGAAGELDYVAVGLEQQIDPCAAALAGVAERLVRADGAQTRLAPPTTLARCSRPRATATRSPGPWWRSRRDGSRSTSRRSLRSPTSGSSCSAAASAPTRSCWSTSVRSSRSGCRIRRASRSRASATPPY